jgi:hypothetical protein
MPFGSVKLIPGVNVGRTPSLNEAGISASDLIRFKDGLAQKLGGWQSFYPFALSGLPRALHAWQDLNAVARLAAGTTTLFGTLSAGTLTDLTPQTKTTNPAANFSTTIGSATVTIVDAGITNVTTFDAVYFNTPVAVGGLILSGLYPIAGISGANSYTITAASLATATVANGGAVPSFATTNLSFTVTVTLAAHGLVVGSRVNFPIATTVGGVTILGTYVVASVPTAGTFTIVSSVRATATIAGAMNGGNAQLLYYITLGPPATGTGYGVGGYGVGGYGSGSVGGSQIGTAITTTDWTLDNWGEIVLAAPFGGGIYYWQPNSGFETAVFIGSGPPFNGGLFVAMPAQILVAWGSTVSDSIGVERDPLLVRWSDQENFLNWTVASTTQAGSFHIPTGSKIVGGLQGAQSALIWTDLDLWAMNYLGPPLVFGFNKIGAGCGLAGAHAAAQLGTAVMWMGRSNFFEYGAGGVQVIPCPVWDQVFQNINTAHLDKVVAGANTPFNEVFFFYPSASSSVCDRYVKYNKQERAWDYGSLGRAAWIDQSVLGAPIGATPSGLLLQHEMTADAAGAPITASFETGYFAIAEGEGMAFVDWLIPDFKWTTAAGTGSASITLTLKATDYPGDTPRLYGPFTVTQATQFVELRLRGRLMSIKVESSDLGSFWRLGNIRYRYAPDGRR